MRKILTIAAILFCSVSFGQTKVKTESAGNYRVEYTYDESVFTIMHKDQPHYPAKIRVFEFVKGDGIWVLNGDQMVGYYVPGGCNQDKSNNSVRRAATVEKLKKKRP